MNEVFRVELFGEKTDRWCELELPATYYGLSDALDKLQMTLGDKPRWEFLEHHGFQFLHVHLTHECDLYQLNALATCLGQMNGRERTAFEGLFNMVEQLHAKGYLKDEVHKAQVQEINDQLRRLKRERQCEFSSGITQMIEELTRLKKLLEEHEEPLDRFDEKLFTEIVRAISISRRDEMTVTLIGGLRFTEML